MSITPRQPELLRHNSELKNKRTPKEWDFYRWKAIYDATPKGCHVLEHHVIPSGFRKINVSFYNHYIPSGLIQRENNLPIYELPLTNYH